jgi:uncharacterized protein
MKGVLSPSQAIQTPELLKGRDKQLDDIRRSLYQEGRQVFIHGYRGVGKTSLAQTAAIQYQSSEAQPILLGCTENGTFYQTIRDLYAAAFPSDPSISKKVEQGGAKAGVGGVSAERKQSIEKSKIAELASVNEAVALTEYVATHHSKKPAVILDEFDLIKSPAEQALFASFVKQLADKRLNIRFFFCGIADSVEEFFGAHESTYRYFHTVKLDRLEFSPRIEIIDTAAKALDIVIDDYTTQRIARISDGFPHFIHLVGEKLFWIVYNDLSSHMKVSPDHFERAVSAAVEDIHPYLRRPYEKATRKYTNESEPILWAIADTHELQRRSSDIYKSYERIMGSIQQQPLPRDRYNNRINNLKSISAGKIVTASRTGWYEFREKMMRGYARLRAEQQGVVLESEHPLQGRKFATNNL